MKAKAAAKARVWVVAADAARARIFSAVDRNGRLAEIEDLSNPIVRLPASKVHADRQGHAANAGRGGGHSLQRNASGAHQLAEDFARKLARRLVAGRRRGEVDRIYLMAEPHLLGALRNALDAPTRRLVAGELAKDLSRQRPTAIRQRLPAEL